MGGWIGGWVLIAVPEADRDTANALASAIDPDTGGDRTFGDPNVLRNGSENWCLACTKTYPETADLLAAVDVDGLLALAVARGRVTQAEADALRAALLDLATRVWVRRVDPGEDVRAVIEAEGFTFVEPPEPPPGA